MRAPVFKDEFKPMSAKEKCEWSKLLKDLRAADKDPRFREFVEGLKSHHLGLKK